MKSIGFPNMFQSTSTTKVVENSKATAQNLWLLLGSGKGELFGDPYFGIRLKFYMFEQNNYILRDVLIDELYSQISIFMPQITVTKKDITIEQTKGKLIANVKCINKIDYTTDMFNIVLLSEEIE